MLNPILYYIYHHQMGNDPPKNQNVENESGNVQKTNKLSTTNSIEDEEDIYILQDLQKLSLKAQNKYMHYWIDPKIFSGQNQKYENYLKKFVDLQGCSSIDGLMNQISSLDLTKKVKLICAASLKDQQYKRLQSDSRISTIYLFCQNQERAKLLMSNFPKIKTAKFDVVQLKQFLVHEQSTGEGVDPKTNILLTIEDDANLMNKYRVNFHSLTSCKTKEKAKSEFISFAKKTYPEKMAEITQFQQNYKLNLSSLQSYRQTLYWLGRPGFFWESTQTLPKITTDPKKLAYLRFVFKEAYTSILKEYKQRPEYLSEVFIVFTPTKEQLEKLTTNIENFLIFTSFVKAYKSQKKAKQAMKKNPHSYLVRVMMKLPPKICDELDFGYYVLPASDYDPDVVFNIYNVFQVMQFQSEQKQFTFQYGSLAEVAYIREKQRGTRLSPFQQKLLRNYDYLQDIISRIDSQATILQMSGHFEDSLLIHSQKLEQIRKSQPSQQILDKHTIDLGDAYRSNQHFKKAEEQYLSIKEGKMALIAKVHLAQLYFKTKENEKLRNVVGELQKNITKYKSISQPDSFKAQNYIGMELMNRSQYKQAGLLYRNLTKEINQFYDYKFQGIPLVHQIYRNRALCETKLNNFTEALNLLDSTKGWQRICEGNKSPGLIITENLIKSVYQSRGQTEEASQCEKEIQKLRQSSIKQQNEYMARNAIIPNNLNESFLYIQVSSSPPLQQVQQVQQAQQAQVHQGLPKPILQQSAVVIDL